MPNIRSYDAPQDLRIRPDDRGVQSLDQSARRISGSYNEAATAKENEGARWASTVRAVGEVAVKYAEHREVSAGAANFAAMQDNLTKQWNETAKTADPNDPTTAAKFREDVVEPALQQYSEGFLTEGGQKFATSHTASLREHMYAKTAADMSTLAGVALKQNLLTTVNRYSSTVRNDPSSLDSALKNVESSLTAMANSSPNIDAATAARVKAEISTSAKGEIVKSFLMGVAEKNPDQAEKIVESGKYAEFISGSDAKTLIGYARTNARLIKSEARDARVMAEHTAKLEFNDAANKLELSTVPQNPGDRPMLPKNYWETVRQLGRMPGAQLDPGRLKTLVDNGDRLAERLNKPEPLGPKSHNTTMDLLQRMRAPVSDPRRVDTNEAIYDAYTKGDLNSADYNFLQREFKDMRTPEGEQLGKAKSAFLGSVENQIGKSNPLMGKIDPSGDAQNYRFTVDLENKIAEYRKAGKNPYDLMDPSKPDFMGSPKALAPYKTSLQDSVRNAASAVRPSVNQTGPGSPEVVGMQKQELPPVKPRQPNESPAEYLKRLGVK